MKMYVIMYIDRTDGSFGVFDSVYLTRLTAESVVAVLTDNDPNASFDIAETTLEEKWVH